MVPTKHERQVLEMVDGSRQWESGAWVNACLEFLRDSGLITEYIGAYPALTDAGRRALQEQGGGD